MVHGTAVAESAGCITSPTASGSSGRDSENAAVEGALSELCGLSRNGSEPPDRPRGALIPSPKAALWRRPAVVTRSSGSLSTWRAGWSSRCWPPSRTRNRGKLLTVDAPSWARPRTLRAAGATRRPEPRRAGRSKDPADPLHRELGAAVQCGVDGLVEQARDGLAAVGPRPRLLHSTEAAPRSRTRTNRRRPAAARRPPQSGNGPLRSRRRVRAPPPPLTSPAPPFHPRAAPRAAPPHPAPTSAAGHVPLAHVLPPPPQLRHSRWSGLRCPRHGPG